MQAVVMVDSESMHSRGSVKIMQFHVCDMMAVMFRCFWYSQLREQLAKIICARGTNTGCVCGTNTGRICCCVRISPKSLSGYFIYFYLSKSDCMPFQEQSNSLW